MTTVNIRDLTLIETLKTEMRICEQCFLEVRHPLVERCPRCYALLPRLELACQGCYHRSQCPVSDGRKQQVDVQLKAEPHQ
jgi:predicted amidophosphoribosyltransferase